jgi:hypothetical protein
LLIFTNSLFANNKDLLLQIGYILVLIDLLNKANIVYWSLVKCKRIIKSVLASKLYAMAYGFNISTIIKATVELQLNISLPLILCTNFKSIYECLIKLGTTQEKRLIINVICLCQSYKRRKIAKVKWIDGNSNLTDAITKSKPLLALKRLINTNQIKLKTIEWVKYTTLVTQPINA